MHAGKVKCGNVEITIELKGNSRFVGFSHGLISTPDKIRSLKNDVMISSR